jgi:cytochrome c2
MKNKGTSTTMQMLLIMAVGGLFLYALVSTLLTFQSEQVATVAAGGGGGASAQASGPPPGPDIAGFLASSKPEAQAYGEELKQGKSLFENNCTQCHAMNEQIVGPALANVLQRQDHDWLVNFIKYPEKVITSGDEYAVALYDKYKQYMPNHDFMSDDEVSSILSYVEAYTDPKSFE